MIKVKKFMKTHKQFTVFLFLAAILVIIAAAAPYIAPMDPYETVMEKSLKAPDSVNICGTDKLGRDLFSRIIYGTRISLTSTLVLVSVTCIAGTFLGIIAGYFGGFIDSLIMRIADMMISFPGIVLAIAISGIMGANMINAVIALGAVSWTKYARLSRSLTLKIKNSMYIQAAEASGTKKGRILLKYILPNLISTMLVTAASELGTMMLELASLSFLGFGAQAPSPEWGYMLNEGRTYITKAPWLMIYPGIAIMIVVVIFNMLGDSVRDLTDTKV